MDQINSNTLDPTKLKRYHADNVLTLVYPPCALGTMAMFAYYEANINTRRRTLLGYTIFCLGILGLILIDLVTIGRGGSVSFIFICIIIGFFGIAGASVEGGVVGDISFMHPEFIQSFFAGIAASGVLTSMLRLITKAAFDRTQDGLQKGAYMGSMIILMTSLGLTHGYLTVCAFTVSSQGFQAPEQNAIGNLLVLTLLAGTSFGVALNWLWIFSKF